MPKNLVIVESPAKAKTIEGYLGKEFQVMSSYGHVRDLAKGDKAIDIQNGFEPLYEISEDKIEIIKTLKKLADEAEVIWLATDDDREGEAISWHLLKALKIDEDKTKRIVFREITKKAILKAIENPRKIDVDLVNAQQARRILDRLVGYEISPILWKKIKAGLSAGRVQSVAVRLVVEREREVEQFNSTSHFKIKALLSTHSGKSFSAFLPKDCAVEGEAMTFLETCLPASYKVNNIEVKPGKRSPAPPFTTSTLQQEASRKLGFSVSQTMAIAQRLYESGKISYMRTDSTSLSEFALSSAGEAIKNNFGEDFHFQRQFKTKSETAQEAHEAIRPTEFSVQSISGENQEQKLYDLIWKRAIASQMADAQIEKTIVTIGISTTPQSLQATGEVIKFEGFLKVYMESSDNEEVEEDENKILPAMSIGENLGFQWMKATQRFTRPSPRYTEASLVKKLEEMGIGRPSTYAPTVTTIEKRGYAAKESREGKKREYRELFLENGNIKASTLSEVFGIEKNKLFPTDIGMIVNDFLVKFFDEIVDYTFTATVEKEFDEIANGKKNWHNMIDQFYHGFHKTVEKTHNVDRSEVQKSRELGKHPETGQVIQVKMGRFGPYVQIGEAEEGVKVMNASLNKNQRMDTITIQEALELFKMPRQTGEFESKLMTVGIGKFGPYVKHDNNFISLPKDGDPYTITEEECILLIEAKRLADSNKIIKTFESNPDIKVLNGRFGPYVVIGKQNVKIPKGKEPIELTLEECLALGIEQADKPGKPKGKWGKKK